MNWPLHGSNPKYIYESLHLSSPGHVLDFSVNLNPFGPPPSIKEHWESWLDHIADYPDPKGERLVELIAEKERVQKESILLGNGGAELFTLLGQLLAEKRVVIVQPTFTEYEKICRAHGCHVSFFQLEEGDGWKLHTDLLLEKIKNADALFVCHPNNPTGTAYPESVLLEILAACQTHDCFFIVDEAFADFLDENRTLASYIKHNAHLIIVRSVTKMYAIAGLRLGFLLASPQVVARLRSFQPYWAVNALALLAGEHCLQEEGYAGQTRQWIGRERQRIFESLWSAGYILSASKVNFYLLKDPSLDDQFPLFIFLLKKGIVPRHTMNYPGLEGRWLRFGVRQAKENDILLEALWQWKHQR
ncbi:threonine-phosphate decarboxylase CobD [Siminovitchia sp. 179-K 8D1 HS]|uniref:threonine-phosphate decarboxylase CobD n=1 Tax=Siminovitchia sp. 179-K 8D1 HS TaxID=3142385 RepID=UPI0039A2808F